MHRIDRASKMLDRIELISSYLKPGRWWFSLDDGSVSPWFSVDERDGGFKKSNENFRVELSGAKSRDRR